jgi:SAM-dependent methyltransferase
MAQFYPGAELNRDPSNWWSPNMPALEGMLRTCGFAPYKIIQNGVRACVHSQYVPGFVPEAIPASKGTTTGKADLPTITPNEVEQALPPTPEPPTVVTVGGEDELVRSYEASFIEAIEEDGSIYAPMTTVIQAGHERRMELLDRLPIGDISGKVCVDYGVGSWGFACIYPRLQQCGYAIGIDISEAAIQESAAISANGSFPYGQNYRYFTSRGTTIDLETGSVDIFFAGECIEHVENTEAFLDEVHRVLKPQGIFILTTPNADAYLFQSRNERYAVGPEHVALMGYNELVGYLKPRFSIVQANGFNGAMHPIFDDQINNATVAKAWAAQFLDNPELGTGVVVMAQRNDNHTRHTYQQQIYHHSHPQFSYQGNWNIVPLHRAMTGIQSHTIGDSLSLSFTGTGLILNFWTHDWSGIAEVLIDNHVREINLYSPLGGFERLVVGDLPIGPHTLTIRITGNKDPRSNSHEIIFYQAISYTKH